MRKTVLVLLTIAGLILAGCGPAVIPQNTQTESGEPVRPGTAAARH